MWHAIKFLNLESSQFLTTLMKEGLYLDSPPTVASMQGKDESRQENRRKIELWLDCDPGHDDAFAILFSAYHPSLALLGVSTVHGNAPLERTTKNALGVLETIGQSSIPVFAGAGNPFCRTVCHAPEIHGKTGLDGTDLLSHPSKRHSNGDTIRSMRDKLMGCSSNTAWLVTTGSLTNAALLFATFPEVGEHIRGLSIMGGAVGSEFTGAHMGKFFEDASDTLRAPIGNYTPYAEFNLLSDPESAQAIFSNPVLSKKTTLITLDLTHQVLATASIQRMLLHGVENSTLAEPPAPHRLRQMFHELLSFFSRTYLETFGFTDGPPLHDPLAVAVLLADLDDRDGRIDFDDRKGERFDVNVQLSGPEMGRSVIRAVSEGVRIPRGINIKAFWATLDSCLDRAIEHLGKA